MESNGLSHNWETGAVTEYEPVETPLAHGPENWQDPASPVQILQNLEDFSSTLRATIEQQSQIRDEMHFAGQQMSQVFGAMSQLLDMMYEQVVAPVKNGTGPAGGMQHFVLEQPVEVAPKSLEPLAESMTVALGELHRRMLMSEDRQMTALEATLKQLEHQREMQTSAQMTFIESARVQTKLEFNRLLQVLLVSTGVAAAFVAGCFLILR
jgi:hypothetical protein